MTRRYAFLYILYYHHYYIVNHIFATRRHSHFMRRKKQYVWLRKDCNLIVVPSSSFDYQHQQISCIVSCLINKLRTALSYFFLLMSWQTRCTSITFSEGQIVAQIWFEIKPYCEFWFLWQLRQLLTLYHIQLFLKHGEYRDR